MGRPPARRGRERASALPLVAGAMVVVMSALGVMATLGGSMVSGARVDTTADLVALAAVVAGPDAAGRVAAANGATLVAHRRGGRVTVVEVARGGHRAAAAASLEDRTPLQAPAGR